MNTNDKTKAVTGQLKVVKTNAEGVTTQEFEVPNLVVNTGLAYICQRMLDTGTGHTLPTDMTVMGVGSDNAAAVPGDTGLGAQNDDRRAFDSYPVISNDGAGGPNNRITYVATFGPGESTGYYNPNLAAGSQTVGGGPLVEAGIFNANATQAEAGAADVGTMLCRTVFLPVNKELGDTITITWTVTIS
jgi:hypothetical protein